jgi:hypothetical protein
MGSVPPACVLWNAIVHKTVDVTEVFHQGHTRTYTGLVSSHETAPFRKRRRPQSSPVVAPIFHFKSAPRFDKLTSAMHVLTVFLAANKWPLPEMD